MSSIFSLTSAVPPLGNFFSIVFLSNDFTNVPGLTSVSLQAFLEIFTFPILTSHSAFLIWPEWTNEEWTSSSLVIFRYIVKSSARSNVLVSVEKLSSLIAKPSSTESDGSIIVIETVATLLVSPELSSIVYSNESDVVSEPSWVYFIFPSARSVNWPCRGAKVINMELKLRPSSASVSPSARFIVIMPPISTSPESLSAKGGSLIGSDSLLMVIEIWVDAELSLVSIDIASMVWSPSVNWEESTLNSNGEIDFSSCIIPSIINSTWSTLTLSVEATFTAKTSLTVSLLDGLMIDTVGGVVSVTISGMTFKLICEKAELSLVS